MAAAEDSIKCVFITPEYFDEVVEFAADHFTLVQWATKITNLQIV